MESCNKIIGYRIAAVRSAAAESQGDLAAALGVKREMVNYWENGTRPIKAEMIVAIAKKYGVSADYLLGFTAPDVKTPSIETRAICDYTGLNESAVEELHKYTTEHENHVFNRKALNKIVNNEQLKKVLGNLALAEKAAVAWESSKRGVVIFSNDSLMKTDKQSGMVSIPGYVAEEFFLRQAEHEFSLLFQSMKEGISVSFIEKGE